MTKLNIQFRGDNRDTPGAHAIGEYFLSQDPCDRASGVGEIDGEEPDGRY
jgi:hypothetical protein